MATAAVALDVRLEKPGRYVLNPAAEPPTGADGERAVRLVRLAGGVAVAVAVVALLIPSVMAGRFAARSIGPAAAFAFARSTPGVFGQ